MILKPLLNHKQMHMNCQVATVLLIPIEPAPNLKEQ